MLNFKVIRDQKGEKVLLTPIYGKALLTIPQLNKGTAFTEQERLEFGLIGKLPPHVETLEGQVKRAHLQYLTHDTEIQKNIYLNYLLNVNQVLFYRLISQYTAEMLPKIYTPVVGSAVEQFSQRYFQSRGLYISFEDQDRIELILNNRSNPNINLIVVSDGEGVLGIGDQGAGAMAIPVAKLMVYTAFGGIDPNVTLPIMLDVGTNNKNLLNDPMYLGWRHERISGKDYDVFINKFVAAVKKLFPHVFLHWEDFGSYNSYNNLANYRHEICSFNDDIQGTGAVAVATILRAVTQTKSNLSEQRIVIFGAGSAGMGIADSIFKAMIQFGIPAEQARKQFWLIDRSGLLIESSAEITKAQADYVKKQEEIRGWNVQNQKHISLLEVVENVRPTILIGCSTVSGAFTQKIIETMTKFVQQPIILPLSNPTERSEATPENIIKWTQGRALVATGSPFPDVTWNGQIYPVSQCNNYFAFPGIGLGVVSVQAKEVSENMLKAASQALSESTFEPGRLLPTIEMLPEASKKIAIAVAKTAVEEGLAQIELQGNIELLVERQIWKPHYIPYHKVNNPA
ncbi:MAG: NAD-dependent malic enzyme [Proteobacteria bacterium]|nr:NAD-dependent malic enzyme [Pseudomonadota bacterium]